MLSGMGRIEVITGGMFSGKTTEWARRLERHLLANKKVAFVKPENENRYGEDIVTDRNKSKVFPAIKLPIEVDINDTEELKKYIEVFEDYEVVGIDEVQFFGRWILLLCDYLQNEGKIVIVNGLDMTYEGKPFGYIGDLMAISFSSTKLHAVCMICGEDAMYSQRLIDGIPAPKGDIFSLGDKEKNTRHVSYEARCINCFVPPCFVEEPIKNVEEE